MAPLLAEGCQRRRLHPVPYLLALACAANVGSAATLIGNPQNMLIGQVLHLSFPVFLAQAGVPAALGLVLVWWLIRPLIRTEWEGGLNLPAVAASPLHLWQTGNGFAILLALIAAFSFTSWPREIVALAAAGVVLLSRRTGSFRVLELIDWQLLVLFGGLFVVNAALAESGLLARTTQQLRDAGIDPAQPGWLFVVTAVLSNLVSNVPATMLLLPVATHPLAGPILALSSTLAGNLLIVGSIANIFVVDQAARLGVAISWKDHARIGIPVTLATLLLAAAWLALLARFQ
jgi:Na+/H+ antiporter NhaD/arsenite permease-like protein